MRYAIIAMLLVGFGLGQVAKADLEKGDWAPLPGEYRNQIKNGIRIARKQIAPNLLVVPVSAPEAAE